MDFSEVFLRLCGQPKHNLDSSAMIPVNQSSAKVILVHHPASHFEMQSGPCHRQLQYRPVAVGPASHESTSAPPYFGFVT